MLQLLKHRLYHSDVFKTPANYTHFTSLYQNARVTRENATNIPKNKEEKENTKGDANHKFRETLNLPKTDFQMYAKKLSFDEITHQARYIYDWQYKNLSNEKLFVSHDGPPYANGDLHFGHALNKILKDTVSRYKILRGHRVNYIPGWDCHGLPIELKALQQEKKSAGTMTAEQIREKAKAFALGEIEKQKKTFQSWGIIGDWENPYTTMDPQYEARQLGIFLEMFKKGYIYRGLKPVFWSPSSRTALAEAELEYPEKHTSTSVYVAFPITKLSSSLSSLNNYPNLQALIWTTTPWTLPANLAITVNAEVTYCIASPQGNSDVHYLLANDRVSFVEGVIGQSLDVKTTFLGKELSGTQYRNPIRLTIGQHVNPDTLYPFITGDHVTTQSGTGLVHTAPGHGMEDFVVCKQHGIQEIRCPVDTAGRFTGEVGLEQLVGLDVLNKGNDAVVEYLKNTQNGNNTPALIKVEKYDHKYPYDWRTKKPIIIRATNQWFASLKGIQNAALEAVAKVQMVPPVARNRLESMVTGRDDWCISRQRVWGVPIPVFYKKKQGTSENSPVGNDLEPLITNETIEHIQNLVAQHGSDCWWKMSVQELLPPRYRNDGNEYIKGTDTMDVWFDSGVSWNSVLANRNLPVPADLYLEGSDQHRGWFQSSLLTAVSVTGQAPYKTVVTHGFTLDDKGMKMSKSLGNVIDPRVVVEGGKNTKEFPAYGVDVLRTWASHCDFSKDVFIGAPVLAKVAETVRKLRNTMRFCLANLYDFDPLKDSVPFNQLRETDRYLLHQLALLSKTVTESYEKYQFYKVYRALADFVSVELSGFYFETNKDILYAELPNDIKRRSVQTVLYEVVQTVTKSFAPMASHTAEEIYHHLQQQVKVPSPVKSLFETGWFNEKLDSWIDSALEKKWNVVKAARNEIYRKLEAARIDKIIHSALECHISLYVLSPSLFSILNSLGERQLNDLLVSSSTTLVQIDEKALTKLVQDKAIHLEQHEAIVTTTEGDSQIDEHKLYVVVNPPKNHKCPRCWQMNSTQADHLCQRCDSVVNHK